MTHYHICAVDDLDEGGRILKSVGGREIAVFRVDNKFVAVANYCVHAGGPVCEGKLSGTITADPREWGWRWGRENEILTCPWHGWEFDLLSGEYLSDDAFRLVTYEVAIEEDEVYVITGTDRENETTSPPRHELVD